MGSAEFTRDIRRATTATSGGRAEREHLIGVVSFIIMLQLQGFC